MSDDRPLPDIVVRLRAAAAFQTFGVAVEAADEIDLLRAQLRIAFRMVENLSDRLAWEHNDV